MDETTFKVTESPDGMFHVQNIVGMYLGQHHIHSKKGFEEWKKKAAPENKGKLKIEKGVCNCGLKPGWVREINGRDWFNANFGEEPEPSASGAAVPPPQELPKVEAPSSAPVEPPEKTPVKGVKGDQMSDSATATATPKAGKKSHSEAARRAWAVRRKLYGKNGIGKAEKKAKREKAGAESK